MTKIILAKELKQGDVILVPGISHRFVKIRTVPEITDGKVNCFGDRMRNKTEHDIIAQNSPVQFGQDAKVELIIQ